MTEKENVQKGLGYFFALGFCIATALSAVMIHTTTAHLNPFFSLFMTTLIGIIYFNGVSFLSIKNSYQASYSHTSLWIIISLFVAGNWVTTFLSLSLVNPFVFIFTYFAASGFIATCFEYAHDKNKINLVYCIGIAILLLFFLRELSTTGSPDTRTVLGSSIAMISAGCGYGYRRFSYIFSRRTKLNAVQVLSVRFYLLLLLAMVLMPWHDFRFLNIPITAHFLVLTALTFLIPLYCMQKSVLIIGAENFSVLTSLCPAATALLLLTFYKTYDLHYLLLSGCIALLTCYKIFGRNAAQKTIKNGP